MENKVDDKNDINLRQIDNTNIPNCCGSCVNWDVIDEYTSGFICKLGYDSFIYNTNYIVGLKPFYCCNSHARLDEYKLTHEQITSQLISAAQENNPMQHKQNIRDFIYSQGNLPIHDIYIEDIKIHYALQSGMIAVEMEIQVLFDDVDGVPELVGILIQDVDNNIIELSINEAAEVYANNKVVIDDAMIKKLNEVRNGNENRMSEM